MTVILFWPASSRARTGFPPPFVDVLVVGGGHVVIVQHGAQTTPELGVDEVTVTFPGEVGVVQRRTVVQEQQILRQVERRVEIVDVDE